MFGEMSDQRNQPGSMRNILLTRLNTNINRNAMLKCAFCERYGHTVHNCSDPGMMIIGSDLINIKRSLINDHNIALSEKRHEFYQDICYKSNRSDLIKNRLKCYAVRHCGASFLDDYSTWTMKICNKIYDMTNDEEDDVIHSVLTPDYLPFDDNDALNYLIDADDMMSNDINRNIQRIEEDRPNGYRNIQREISANANIIERDRINGYSNTGLQILSYLAQIRLEELIHSTTSVSDAQTEEIIEPNTSIHTPQYVECYVNKNYTPINNNQECSICYETKDTKEFVMTNCSHSFCCDCMKKTVNICGSELKCAMCRTKIVKLSFNDKDNCEKF
jgi:hypothetical protein